ncbi:MAG: FAD:protein FMN transferase [Pseudomonadota bacterium]|nr:FAD:protein FMN transferase [Pseudomonadota bacterium]
MFCVNHYRLYPGLVLALSFLCMACTQKDGLVYHDQFFAFGTLIDLTFYEVNTDTAEQASLELEQLFLRMQGDWHAWQPGALQHTNEQLATLEGFPADPAVLPLIREATRLSTLGNELFNPTIGRLIALWGFHGEELPEGPPPGKKTIEALVHQIPSTADVTINGNHLINSNPAVQYDLGAFAKGYAIDRGIDLLQHRGIRNAIINAGGDLRAIGRHGERAWRIGIRHPRQPGVLATIELAGDESIFTSGDYERYFEFDGKRYHHIIDPRSGYPAKETVSVTVIHPNAATADAAATALFVAGPEHWAGIARQMGIHYVMLIGHKGVIHMNPAMQSRIIFEAEPPETRLSDPLQ